MTMSLYEWKDNYSVEIASIDEDHKGLLSLINMLFDAMSHGMAKEILSETLSKLIAYTKIHFKREEIYLSTTNYPYLQEHKMQHEFFIEKINDLKKEFDNGSQQISVDLIKFLTDWLINHILVSDKKFMSHLKKYGIT
jgi:hemerythrin